MLKSLFTIIFCFCVLSSFTQTCEAERLMVKGEIKDQNLDPVSYAHILVKSRNEGSVGDFYGKFLIGVFPGDTLIISAVSFHHAVIPIPIDIKAPDYYIEVIMLKDTVNLKELVVHPWPSTYQQLKKDFMKVGIDDPAADINLHLPSIKDLAALLKTPGVPGQIGIYSGPGPFSMLYNQFSKESKSKRIYADLIRKEKSNRRYNKILIARITGMEKEDDINKFMEFCALQIKFILESTDYELYAAILNCYDEFCKAGLQNDDPGE